MKKYFILMFTITLSVALFAGKVDTISIYSCVMQKDIKCIVITPQSYKKKKNHFPVVYLLHGFSGNYSNWIKKVPELSDYADTYNIMIVCPDGGYSSWYFDSPIDDSMKYESFIAAEVVHHIDNNYRTIKESTARALTGLSMGGHGGMFLGLRHPKTFGAIGSMSGALDVNYIKTKYHVEKRLGDTLTHAENWKKFSLFAMVDTLQSCSQKILIDCGTEDFVLPFSETMHTKLMKNKIQHDYILRPGKHDWSYWSNAVQYQLLFFNNYFKKNATAL
jgi:S-formylglutathione hydrolase FrmB